jgi:hypothetical protein
MKKGARDRQAPFFIYGGVDGARTRDFQRDRLAL